MEILTKIQNEVKVPKGNTNKFGNYKYRSAEDILEVVKPVLLAHKATLIVFDTLESIGNRLFNKATARLIIGKDTIETFGYAELSEHKGMSPEQANGTASSYSRKYALNGLFLIDETESDADSQEPKKEEKKASTPDTKKEPAKVDLIAGTENCQKVITYLAGGGKIEEVLKKYNISETLLKELTK